VQGQENDARELLARKLVAEKRIATCEGELEQLYAERNGLHVDGCTVLRRAQALNVSTNVADPDERQVRLRLREECRNLEKELDRLGIELDAWKAEFEARRRAAISTAPVARPGAPLGERNSRVIPQDVKIAVSARDGGKCCQCGSTKDLHYDHVIPWSKGGANTVANIQLLCGPCNLRKGASDPSAY
jgi:5-methylcytosine-specific restriction endonuclease McrA